MRARVPFFLFFSQKYPPVSAHNTKLGSTKLFVVWGRNVSETWSHDLFTARGDETSIQLSRKLFTAVSSVYTAVWFPQIDYYGCLGIFSPALPPSFFLEEKSNCSAAC